MKNKFLIILILFVLIIGCADSKNININGKDTEIQPYGWMNQDELKNDSVVYRINTGNVIWSVLLCETIIAPILITGIELFEPVSKK